MKILILDPEKKVSHRISKDTSGGYGTGNDFGDTLVPIFLKKSQAGRIINIASVYAFAGGGGPVYLPAKAGLVNETLKIKGRTTIVEHHPPTRRSQARTCRRRWHNLRTPRTIIRWLGEIIICPLLPSMNSRRKTQLVPGLGVGLTRSQRPEERSKTDTFKSTIHPHESLHC